MTPRPALHLPLNGSLAGTAANVAVTATGNGALRYRDADLGGRQCALVEEAGTNLVVGPQGMGAGATATAHNGTKSVEEPWFVVTRTVTGAYSTLYMGSSHPSASVGNSYAMSMLCRTDYAALAWIRASIEFNVSGSWGSATYDDFATPGTDTHAAEIIATAPASTSAARWMLTVASNAAPIGIKAFATNIQIEQSDHISTYIDGSLGTGYAWSGTPHASTSTRALTTIEADYPSTIEHIFCRYSEDFGETWATASLTSATTFGSYASFDLTSDVLTIESTRALMVRDVAVYDVELSAGEEAAVIAAIEAGDSLDFGKPFPGVFHHFGRIAGKHWPAIVTVNGSY